MYTFYVIRNCPYCKGALELARKKKLEMEVKYVKKSEKDIYKEKHGMQTFPQIFHGKRRIGGYSDFAVNFQ